MNFSIAVFSEKFGVCAFFVGTSGGIQVMALCPFGCSELLHGGYGHLFEDLKNLASVFP